MLTQDQSEPMIHIGFKVPVWMFDAINEVQARHKLVTRTEATRLILVKGLETLGEETSR